MWIREYLLLKDNELNAFKKIIVELSSILLRQGFRKNRKMKEKKEERDGRKETEKERYATGRTS